MKAQHKSILISVFATLSASLLACAEVTPPKNCEDDFDCEDNELCRENVCISNTCKDGLLSAGETDVDCGGACSAKCADNKMCQTNSDCSSGTCENNQCINPERDCAVPRKGDLLITEILNNASAGKPFSFYNIDSTQTEFFEIYNNSDQKLSLTSTTIQCRRLDDGSDKTVSFSMNGCLEKGEAVVVSNAAIANLPEGVINLQTIQGSGALINTAKYQCSLITGGQPIHEITTLDQAKAGISEVLPELFYDNYVQALQSHADLSPDGAKHSPGYCTNGALYINHCENRCDNGAKDPGETDIDCGGVLCNACADALKCASDIDCISGHCLDGFCDKSPCQIAGCPNDMTCDEESGKCFGCSDDELNGDETDIDCGGSCSACDTGKKCVLDNDCSSRHCEDGFCTGQMLEIREPAQGEIIIAEVLNNANTSDKLAAFNGNSSQNQIEFFELINTTDSYLNLDHVSIELKRLDKDASGSLPLNGYLEPHQVAVVSGTPIETLPEGVQNIVLDTAFAANTLTNTATYQYQLMLNKTTPIDTKMEEAASKSGISNVRNDEDASSNALVAHTSINAGLKHSPGFCTNGALYAENCALTCENGQKDGDETDVDCGGSCSKCETGGACKDNSDCSSDLCIDNKCKTPGCTSNDNCSSGICNSTTGECELCTDGVKNGTETDVDCGGLQCDPCDAGQKCQANIDCASYQCSQFVCTGTPIATFHADELVINEIMGSPKTSTTFSIQNQTAQCEFIEIVSIAKSVRNLNGWSVEFRKAGTEDAPTSIPMFNLLEPKHGLVIHNCSELALPDGMREQIYNPVTNFIPNTSDIEFWLTNGTEKSPVILRKGLSANGKSQTLQNELDQTSPLVFHDTVNSKLLNSPGYCANGGMFINDCQTTCTNGKQDEGETDIDCGGPCSKCENGLSCRQNTDCLSSYCDQASLKCTDAPCTKDAQCAEGSTCDIASGVCISCSDGIQNGSETDVDCGGSCGQCKAGQHCNTLTDCDTGICTGGLCTDLGVATADPTKLIVNEIFDYGTNSPKFMLNGEVTACEFVEIANPTTKDVNLYGLKLILKGKNSSNVSQTPVTIPLSGILESKHLLVVHNCENLPLPADAIELKAGTSKMITGTWTYDIELVSDDITSTQISSLAIGSVIRSSYNRDPDMTANAPMVKTTDMSSYADFATPGYCANGGLYSEGCKTACENGIKDGDETDVDCGGSCGQCGNNKACTTNADCESGLCTSNRCTVDTAVKPEPADLVINEVMAAPSSATLALNDGKNACEFIEVVNVSNHELNLTGTTIQIIQTTTSTTNKNVPMSGKLAPKAAFVAHNCPELPLPEGTLATTFKSTFLTDSATFEVWIDVDGKAGKHAQVAKAKSGVSMNRAADLDVSSELATLHTSLNSAANASPGYCANGKTFATDCK